MLQLLPVLKMLVVSKTMQGAGAVSAAALVELLPKALDGDAQAVGLLVLTVVGYARAAYGRWVAERKFKKEK